MCEALQLWDFVFISACTLFYTLFRLLKMSQPCSERVYALKRTFIFCKLHLAWEESVRLHSNDIFSCAQAVFETDSRGYCELQGGKLCRG